MAQSKSQKAEISDASGAQVVGGQQPAFPVSIPGCGDNGQSGMTLRDYFAGQALPAVITATSAGQHRPMRDDGLDLVRSMARDAYEIADAMLAARTLSSLKGAQS